MSKAIKEIIFALAFFLVIIFIIGVLFYEFLPSEVIPEAATYKQSASTAKLLSQIEEEQQVEEEETKSESILKSYEVTSEKLEKYEDKEYVSGKNHPFFNYTKVLNEEGAVDGTISDMISGNSSSGNSSSSDNTSTNNSTSNDNAYTNTSKNEVDTSGLRDTSNTSKVTK